MNREEYEYAQDQRFATEEVRPGVSMRRHPEPDPWLDAENERLTEQYHEPSTPMGGAEHERS